MPENRVCVDFVRMLFSSPASFSISTRVSPRNVLNWSLCKIRSSHFFIFVCTLHRRRCRRRRTGAKYKVYVCMCGEKRERGRKRKFRQGDRPPIHQFPKFLPIDSCKSHRFKSVNRIERSNALPHHFRQVFKEETQMCVCVHFRGSVCWFVQCACAYYNIMNAHATLSTNDFFL